VTTWRRRSFQDSDRLKLIRTEAREAKGPTLVLDRSAPASWITHEGDKNQHSLLEPRSSPLSGTSSAVPGFGAPKLRGKSFLTSCASRPTSQLRPRASLGWVSV
jgi:hypothetical protein